MPKKIKQDKTEKERQDYFPYLEIYHCYKNIEVDFCLTCLSYTVRRYVESTHFSLWYFCMKTFDFFMVSYTLLMLLNCGLGEDS